MNQMTLSNSFDSVTGGVDSAEIGRIFDELNEQFPNELIMVIMNIKRFQIINHIYGYSVGNLMLKKVYEAITKYLRPQEYAVRLFKDTFVFFLHEVSKEEIIDRILKIDKEIYFIHYQGIWMRMLLSFGVYYVNSEDNFLQALDCANSARIAEPDYSKYSTSYEFFNEELHQDFKNRHQIELLMMPSLEQEEFEVYIQPKVELKTGKIVAGEALIRWFHQGKEIPLSSFMPILNQNTFIRKIDQYVFNKLCQLFTRWKEEGFPAVPISVNLSRSSFQDPEFLNELMAIYNRYDVEQKWFEFELSEEIEMNSEAGLLEFMNKLSELGFACSLDDFGAGYSSLNILQALPIMTLKLDRCFFTKPMNEKNCIILKQLLAITRQLGLTTLAEGVETQEYVDFLEEHGCDMIQSFFFERPIPIAEFEKIVIAQPFLKEKQV